MASRSFLGNAWGDILCLQPPSSTSSLFSAWLCQGYLLRKLKLPVQWELDLKCYLKRHGLRAVHTWSYTLFHTRLHCLFIFLSFSPFCSVSVWFSLCFPFTWAELSLRPLSFHVLTAPVIFLLVSTNTALQHVYLWKCFSSCYADVPLFPLLCCGIIFFSFLDRTLFAYLLALLTIWHMQCQSLLPFYVSPASSLKFPPVVFHVWY